MTASLNVPQATAFSEVDVTGTMEPLFDAITKHIGAVLLYPTLVGVDFHRY